MTNRLAATLSGLSVATCIRPVVILFAIVFVMLWGGVQYAWAVQTATNTTLVVTSGGSAVTEVPAKSVVTLTATVKAGTTPLTVGQVNFCDAKAKYCTDIHLLGMAQLTSAGTATLKFRPGAGSHKYKAVFLGTNNDASSVSSLSSLTVTTLAQTENYSTATSIAESGTVGDYTLTATVTGTVPGFGNLGAPPSPTGTVSFSESIGWQGELGSADLVPGATGFSWASSQTSSAPVADIAVADFNGDGILDIADLNKSSPGNVKVLLGNGDGTFTATAGSPATGNQPSAIAVGDFNGDGIADLAVANTETNNVTILRGKGDGTFKATASPAVGSGPIAIAVGDFNGDGIADLAVANSSDGTITILLGKGDGTFTEKTTPLATGSCPSSIAAADFDGDGKPDLSVFDSCSNTVAVLLGSGDGTFATPVNIYKGHFHTSSTFLTSPESLRVGDFNGDGMADLAVTNSGSNTVAVLLGNGDGTFSNALNTVIDTYKYTLPLAVAVGDFNGDGIPDLVVGSEFRDVSILTGNGDGTFTTNVVGNTAYTAFVAAADFNGDGIADFALAGGSSWATFLTQMTISGTATASGIAPPVGSGYGLAYATYPGDSEYNPSVSGYSSVVGVPYPLTFSPLSLSFGTEAIGYSTPSKDVTITNTTVSPIAMGSIKLTGANAAEYVTSNTCPASLAGGASCRFGVRFTPKAAGAGSASITVTDSATNSPQTIPLSGTGADVPAGSMSLSATSLTFAAPVGYTTESQNVTVTNTSITTVLYLKTITLTQTGPKRFFTSNTCGGDVGGILGPQQSCQIGVRFVPGALGTQTAAITVTSNAASSPQSIQLSGTGISVPPASLSLSSTTLPFGVQILGTRLPNDPERVVVTNTSNVVLYFKSITLGGADASSFPTTNNCWRNFGGSLAPGAFCLISARFEPLLTGAFSATITLTDNATNSPQTITLTGTAQ